MSLNALSSHAGDAGHVTAGGGGGRGRDGRDNEIASDPPEHHQRDGRDLNTSSIPVAEDGGSEDPDRGDRGKRRTRFPLSNDGHAANQITAGGGGRGGRRDGRDNEITDPPTTSQITRGTRARDAVRLGGIQALPAEATAVCGLGETRRTERLTPEARPGRGDLFTIAAEDLPVPKRRRRDVGGRDRDDRGSTDEGGVVSEDPTPERRLRDSGRDRGGRNGFLDVAAEDPTECRRRDGRGPRNGGGRGEPRSARPLRLDGPVSA